MTMDETKFFDIRRRAFPKRNQHLCSPERTLLRALAITVMVVLITLMSEPLIDR